MLDRLRDLHGSLVASGTAKTSKAGSNLLHLDEPTNDLDTETRATLEKALEGIAGCAVMISHDHMLLDRPVTYVHAFESDSQVDWSEGNCQDYGKDKK